MQLSLIIVTYLNPSSNLNISIFIQCRTPVWKTTHMMRAAVTGRWRLTFNILRHTRHTNQKENESCNDELSDVGTGAYGEVRGQSSHVLVERSVPRQLRLLSAQLQVEVINGDGEDDDEAQDEPQHQGQHLLQLLALVRYAFIRCGRRETHVCRSVPSQSQPKTIFLNLRCYLVFTFVLLHLMATKHVH